MRPDRDRYVADFVDRRRVVAAERGERLFDEKKATAAARLSYTLRFPPAAGPATRKARNARAKKAAKAAERRASLLNQYARAAEEDKKETP